MLALASFAAPGARAQDAATTTAAPVDAAPAPDASPDELAPATASPDAAHGDPNAHATSAPESPGAVVRSLQEDARRGDIAAFQARLSRRFMREVTRLQREGDPGAFAWTDFMSAIAAEDFESVDENFFYERASVRVETTSGRALMFRLVLEDGAWTVDVPRDLEDAIAQRASTPAAPGPVVDAPLVVGPPPEVPPAPPPRGFFDAGSAGHYVWYAADWAFVAASATALAVDAWSYVPPLTVAIGPSFNLDEPDVKGLYDPRLDGVVGHPYLQEKVPPWALASVGAGAVLTLGVVDAVRHLEFHHTHAFVLGALTATMLAADLTEVTKIGVGRLRPDFRDRYARAACAGRVDAPSSFDCEGVTDDGFVVDRRGVVDGMKSFPSTHASTAFALATYLSLYLGGEWVWGTEANAFAMPVATFLMGVAGAAAAYVAATRVADNRHHLEDVVVGAGLGMASGAAGYFLHFDTDGDARWRGFDIVPLGLGGAAGGLGLRARF